MFEHKSISLLYNQFGEYTSIIVYDKNMHPLDICDLSKCIRKIKTAWFMHHNPDPTRYGSNAIVAIVEDDGFEPSSKILEIGNGNASNTIYFANGLTTVRDVLNQTSYNHYVLRVDGCILPIYEEYLDQIVDNLRVDGDLLNIDVDPNKDIDEHDAIRYLKRHMSKDDLIELIRSIIVSKEGK